MSLILIGVQLFGPKGDQALLTLESSLHLGSPLHLQRGWVGVPKAGRELNSGNGFSGSQPQFQQHSRGSRREKPQVSPGSRVVLWSKHLELCNC